jgi:hypothetical protein
MSGQQWCAKHVLYECILRVAAKALPPMLYSSHTAAVAVYKSRCSHSKQHCAQPSGSAAYRHTLPAGMAVKRGAVIAMHCIAIKSHPAANAVCNSSTRNTPISQSPPPIVQQARALFTMFITMLF